MCLVPRIIKDNSYFWKALAFFPVPKPYTLHRSSHRPQQALLVLRSPAQEPMTNPLIA
jgi:hypothetical protein